MPNYTKYRVRYQLISPALLLQADQHWDLNRELPLEPTRWGTIVVLDHELLNRYPFISNLLEKNDNLGSYYSAEVRDTLLKQHRTSSEKFQKQLIEISDNLQTQDIPTAYILNSLLFSPETYKQVEIHIHRRLTESTLGSNKEFPQVFFDFFSNELKNSAMTDIAEENPLTILDPFSGGGALNLTLADHLDSLGINAVHFVNADLSTTALETGKNLIQKVSPQLLEKYKHAFTYRQQDALKMDQSEPHSIDYIVTMRALHELSFDQITRFFEQSLHVLKPGGKLICVDVTSEEEILHRAEQLLPLLGKFSAFMQGMNNYRVSGQIDPEFWDLVAEGDPILSQAGIYSYKAGLKEDDFRKILGSLPVQNVSVDYIKAPPIGGIKVIFQT